MRGMFMAPCQMLQHTLLIARPIAYQPSTDHTGEFENAAVHYYGALHATYVLFSMRYLPLIDVPHVVGEVLIGLDGWRAGRWRVERMERVPPSLRSIREDSSSAKLCNRVRLCFTASKVFLAS